MLQSNAAKETWVHTISFPDEEAVGKHLLIWMQEAM